MRFSIVISSMHPQIEYDSGICYHLNVSQVRLLREAGFSDGEYTRHKLTKSLSKLHIQDKTLKLARYYLMNQGGTTQSLKIIGLEAAVIETEN